MAKSYQSDKEESERKSGINIRQNYSETYEEKAWRRAICEEGIS